MTWQIIVGIIAGSLAAVITEIIFRLHEGPYTQVAPLTLVLAFVVNYGVFNVMKTGDSLIEGLVLWSALTATFRVLSTFLILGETPAANQWVAFGLVIAASFVSKFWR